MLSLIASMLLCALVAWMLFGILTAACYRFIGPALRGIDPGQASNLILAWLSLPPLAALLTTVVMYSPDVTQWLVAGHCHRDSCLQHGPQSTLAIWPAALLLLWTIVSAGRCLLRQWRCARQLADELARTGRDAGTFIQLDAREPAAFTLGWFKPRIFITTAMQAACSAQDIGCILEHEKAHRLRHDNLRLLAATIFTAPLPRNWSEAALADLRLCCEKASDLHAAQTFSRESVAATLLRIARLQQSPSAGPGLAFAGTHTEQRVRALLDDAVAPLPNEYVFASVASALLVVLLIINPLHSTIELLP